MRARIDGGNRHDGITLIELAIVLTIVVILVAIAVPSLISSRMLANEAAAVSQLRAIATAQVQLQKSGEADEDFDGVGEYGTLGELGGRVGVRGLSRDAPTGLGPDMSRVDVAGEVQHRGYVFRVYLPLEDGRGQREQPYGGMPAGIVDADQSELHWVAYTWPATNGISGTRTFVMDEGGEILQTEDPDRSGQNTAYVRAGDAFRTNDPDGMVDELAVEMTGTDGNRWLRLE